MPVALSASDLPNVTTAGASRATHPWLLPVLCIAAIAGTGARLLFARDLPLWFDETFTAVIASQPTPALLVRWCLNELGGPGYYMPMWLWTRLAGDSDMALRLPGLMMSCAAPFVLLRWGSRERTLRVAWAALAFLSLPAIVVANEARPYPQLFLLGCIQAILFRRALEGTGGRSLVGWAWITAWLVLTHYHAVFVGAAEGTILLCRFPRSVLRSPMFVLPFAIAATWVGFHLHFLLAFSRAFGASFLPTPWPQLLVTPLFLLGAGPTFGVLALGLMAASPLVPRRSPAATARIAPADRALAWAGLSALSVEVVLALVRPGFSLRYLMPILPALLFVIALWARRVSERSPMLVAAAGLALAGGTFVTLTGSFIDPQFATRKALSFEQASDWIGTDRPRTLLFFWQDRNQAASASANLAEVARFFLQRRGDPVRVVVARPQAADPNPAIVAFAQRHPGAAILWVRDANAGFARGPAPESLGTARTCRDFGSGEAIVYACRAAHPHAA